MQVADTAGVASLVIQTDVEDGEGAVDTFLTLNQILTAVGELHRVEHPVCYVYGLGDSRAVKYNVPSQNLRHIASCLSNQGRLCNGLITSSLYYFVTTNELIF